MKVGTVPPVAILEDTSQLEDQFGMRETKDPHVAAKDELLIGMGP